jgi:hypothetical protein
VQRSLEGCGRWGEGRGILYFEASVVQWKDIRHWRPKYGPEGKHFVSGLFFYFGGCSEAAMRGGGGQRSVWCVNEPKKTGARSARARTRGQNSLVIIYLSRVLCLCVCVSQFVSERSAILLVLAIELIKETRRRVWRGRDRDGEIGD